jgi:DNA-binding response OmpR family regulator
MKILVASEARTFRESAMLLLSGQGHDVECAMFAEEVLRLIAESSPQLLIMDQELEDQTGLQTLRDLRKEDRHENLGVIMVADVPADHETVAEVRMLDAKVLLSHEYSRRSLLNKIRIFAD